MLQKYYGITVSKMLRVSFHPSIKTYHLVEVPPLEEEIVSLFTHLNISD